MRFNLLKRERIYPAVIIIVGFCYYMTYFNYGISLSDEGFFIYGAERVLQGQLPMSDFYSYPPGSYLLLALLYKWFGVNLVVSRLMEMAFLLLNGLMAFYIGKRLMPGSMALIPSFILIAFPGPWHKVFFTFGLLLPLLVLFRFLETRTRERVLLLGGAIGVALFFKFESALYSLLTAWIILFWIRTWKKGKFLIDKETVSVFLKDVFLSTVGLLIIVLPVLAFYLWRSSLIKLFSVLREIYGMSNLGATSKYFGHPSFIRAVTNFHVGSLANLFFFLVLLLYLYVLGKLVIQLFVRKEKEMPLLLPVVVMGVLSLTYAYSVFEKAHLLQSVAMAYILFGYLIYSLLRRRGVKSKVAMIVLVLLLGLYVADNFKWRGHLYSGSVSRYFAIKKEGKKLLASDKGKVYLGEKQFKEINGLLEYFDQKDGYLLPLYFEPMVNFLTGLENPTRFSILFPSVVENELIQQRVIDDIQRYKVEYLLIGEALWMHQDGFRDYAPKLYEFIMTHYQLERVGQYLIFLRIPEGRDRAHINSAKISRGGEMMMKIVVLG